MRMLFRTRWLLPILLMGLAVLFVKLPSAIPDQALANASLPAEKAGPAEPLPAAAQVAEPAIQAGETPGAAPAEFDDTSCGTY
jgi:hypothetical protein